jgi:hypothetical protein
MIGIIRVRLSSDPDAAGWSDAEWQTLMDPATPFSLAHYWTRASFGLLDLSYTLFDTVTIDDPRPDMTAEQLEADHEGRSARTKAATAAVDARFHPSWSSFSSLIIWCASPFDLWGSSTQDHGHGICGVMTCHIGSRFDQLCHELGHSIGFDHPFGDEGEYDSPYDIMGGYDASWGRLPMSGLPVGMAPLVAPDPMSLIGPLLSAAQLSQSYLRPKLPTLFTQLPAAVQQTSTEVTLQALDAAQEAWPADLGPVAAVTTPIAVSPDTSYVLELRRARGYDRGLRSPGRLSAPPPGIVVHGYDAKLKRFWFAGILPLTSSTGDRDLHLFSSVAGTDITLRLLEVGPDDAWAKVRVGGPSFWRNFGVDIDIQDRAGPTAYSPWEQVDVRPCPFAAVGTHEFRIAYTPHTFVVEARSFGYEAPHYTWTVGGQTLDPASPSGRVTLEVQTSMPDPLSGHWDTAHQDVSVAYTLAGARLELAPVSTGAGPLRPGVAKVGRFHVSLEVTVNETDPGVIQSNYPARTVATSLRWDTVRLEWDQGYRDALAHCNGVRDDVDRKRIPELLPLFPDAGRRPDADLPDVLDILDSLVDTNPAVANAVIDQIGRTTSLSNLEVIARLQQRRQG